MNSSTAVLDYKTYGDPPVTQTPAESFAGGIFWPVRFVFGVATYPLKVMVLAYDNGKKFLVFVGTLLLAGALAILIPTLVKYTQLTHLLKEYRPPLTSVMINSAGDKTTEFYRVVDGKDHGRRFWVYYNDIPPLMEKALIATEDKSFYSNMGLSLSGIIRAVMVNARSSTFSQGGSTITQQLARAVFLTPEKSIMRKVKEAMLAILIDLNLSKKEIIQLYVNMIYLGDDSYGVAAAVDRDFCKTLDQLTLKEIAYTIGKIRSPNRYRLTKHPEEAEQRANFVLDRMAVCGFITISEAQVAKAQIIMLNPRPSMREHTSYDQFVREYMTKKYGDDAIYSGGYEMYTAEDTILQEEATRVVKETCGKYKDGLINGAFFAQEINTGQVKAMVGSRDILSYGFNIAIRGQRQSGSLFKFLIYTAYLDQFGRGVYEYVNDIPVKWPRNYNDKYMGYVPIYQAFARSSNVIAVQKASEVTLPKLVEFAGKVGLPADRFDVDDMSIALGSAGLSLCEVVRAYSLIPNKGKILKPIFITKIVKNGVVVESHRDGQVEFGNVLKRSQTVGEMDQMLRYVVKEGTAQAIQFPVAGKTGTTNDCRDAWFIGYNDKFIMGIWFGYEGYPDTKVVLVDKNFTGSHVAVPAWNAVLKGYTERVKALAKAKEEEEKQAKLNSQNIYNGSSQMIPVRAEDLTVLLN